MKINFETEFGDEFASMNAVRDGKFLDEDYHLWGAVIFSIDGQTPIKLNDDFTMMALRIFLDVPDRLNKIGQVDLSLVSGSGVYSFTIQNKIVQIKGSEGEIAEFPIEDFLFELRSCGLRFLAFMEEISICYPKFKLITKALREGLRTKSV